MSNFKTILSIDTVQPLYSIAIINSNDVVSEISTKKDEKPSEQIIELLDNSLFRRKKALMTLERKRECYF